MRVLNVGCGNKSIPIPAHFDGWEHQALDIDPKSGADVICSALEITERLAKGGYDAIYTSHNLEHYYRHDLPKVLAGFMHALDDDGFVHVRVPNMQDVFQALANGKDVEDVAYIAPCGQIRYLDMIYGLGAMIEASGNDFMCHKNGFTPKSLGNALHQAGFNRVYVGENKAGMELVAYAFKKEPTAAQCAQLKLKETL